MEQEIKLSSEEKASDRELYKMLYDSFVDRDINRMLWQSFSCREIFAINKNQKQ